MRCNFLALSATIGNAEELREWWQTVHDQHVTDELADLEGERHAYACSSQSSSCKKKSLAYPSCAGLCVCVWPGLAATLTFHRHLSCP